MRIRYIPVFVTAVVMTPFIAMAQVVDGSNPFIETLLSSVGLSSGVVAVILLAMKIFLLIGKAIPDSKTGWVGGIRKAAKFLGGYITNKA